MSFEEQRVNIPLPEMSIRVEIPYNDIQHDKLESIPNKEMVNQENTKIQKLYEDLKEKRDM